MKLPLATSLLNLGEILLKTGDYKQSLEAHLESLHLIHEIGYKLGYAFVLESLACLMVRMNQPTHTAVLFGASEAFREALAAPVPAREYEYYRGAIEEASAQISQEI